MAARPPKQPPSRRRSREEETSPPAPPPRARAQSDRHTSKRPKVTERAHSDSDEVRDQEDADEDEEEQEDAPDESQAGSSRNGGTVVGILSSIYQELKTETKVNATRHKVLEARLTALAERSSSGPSSAMGSPLVSFTSFQLL